MVLMVLLITEGSTGHALLGFIGTSNRGGTKKSRGGNTKLATLQRMQIPPPRTQTEQLPVVSVVVSVSIVVVPVVIVLRCRISNRRNRKSSMRARLVIVSVSN